GAGPTGGWHLTVYFTADELLFAGATTAVTGCLVTTCDAPGDPTNDLGSYPQGFVDTVQAEGTGAIASGAFAGQYLNWSGSVPGSGYWLDTAPRNAEGTALVPYVSAAAHPTVPFGASFALVDCGVDSATSAPMDAAACADLRAGQWEVRDRFEADVDVRRLDLYIGLQTELDMDLDPHFVDQVDAVTTLP
ncbi:MAG: hypothetical protein IT373_11615, partial [Polyangiaceae bacterium]|nr:hypothetical protein [Polyangiaceae bacterium]